MKWVPDAMWFTYLQIDARARDLDGDLAVSRSSLVPWAQLVGPVQ